MLLGHNFTMDDQPVRDFPLSNGRTLVGPILRLLFFLFLVIVGIANLIAPINGKPEVGTWIGIIAFGLLFAFISIVTIRFQSGTRIQIEDDTFRYFRGEQLEYEKTIDYVYSLQTYQMWFQIRSATYLVHFCDGRRFSFSSSTNESSELIQILEEGSNKKFGIGNLGPTPEEQIPFKMSNEEIISFVGNMTDRMDAARQKPRSLEEAKERFGNSIVGRWKEPEFGQSPLGSSWTILPDGYAILTWERMLGPNSHWVYQWRQLEPLSVELKQIAGPDVSEEWFAKTLVVEAFQMFETSSAIEFGIRGLDGNSFLQWSGPVDSDMTYESYIQQFPLNIDSDEEDD